MIVRPERREALGIMRRLIVALTSFSISTTGVDGANLRIAVGKLFSDLDESISKFALGDELYTCFEQARLAGATLNSMDNVRNAMFAEAPVYLLGVTIVNAAIIFSIVEQSQIIATIEFDSRASVDDVIVRMNAAIENIKLNKADSFVVNDYQNFIALSALLIQHLAVTELQLPRIVRYQMPINYPALTLSNRIYGDGSRSDELIAENKTVHPAFMQRDIIALSQ
jgi:hypothetical protein